MTKCTGTRGTGEFPSEDPRTSPRLGQQRGEDREVVRLEARGRNRQGGSARARRGRKGEEGEKIKDAKWRRKVQERGRVFGGREVR